VLTGLRNTIGDLYTVIVYVYLVLLSITYTLEWVQGPVNTQARFVDILLRRNSATSSN
jgi:hypothetical protein